MMRVPPTILMAIGVLLAPQAAQAAVLDPVAACYRSVDEQSREPVRVEAGGFTPGERVNVSIDGQVVENVVALTDGRIEGDVAAPFIARGERGFTLTVTEAEQPLNTASTTSRVIALAARLKPQRARPGQRVRFIGSGFTDGPDVYAHYVRKGKLRKTIRLGAAQGPCGRIDVRRRQFPIKRPALGRWIVQLDNHRTFSPEPSPVFARINVTVTKDPRPARAR